MRFAQKGRKNMRREQIEIVIRPVKIGGHGGNEIRAKLACICLTKLNTGDLSYCVSFISWLQRSTQQSCLRNRLRRILRIYAGTAKKKKLTHPSFVSCVDDVVLNP